VAFAFHGLGPLYWPRLTPKAAQNFGVTSLPKLSPYSDGKD